MKSFEKKIFNYCIKKGNLSVCFADGFVGQYGDGTGNLISISAPDKLSLLKIVCNPEWQIPVSFEHNKWKILEGDLVDFILLLRQNKRKFETSFFYRFSLALNWAGFKLSQINNPIKSRNNVKKHYDLDEKNTSSDFYKAFLDKDLYYSCAFFDGTDSLEQAQKNKVNTTINRLNLNQKNLKVLDIGSGWGGLSRAIAKKNGTKVTGITLSKKQYQLSVERANGLCDYQLTDYRVHQGTYNRIVSVGMFEHVGLNQYSTFFNKINELLADDSLALIHSIVRRKPGVTSKWVRKKVFPGGYIPALSEMISNIEKLNLKVQDVYFHEGINYFKTLKCWRENFVKTKNNLNLSEEEFNRWYFYFSASMSMFREPLGFRVAQILIKKPAKNS